MIYTTKITKSNQITLKKVARDALGVKAGEKLFVNAKDDGTVEIHRNPTDAEIFSRLDSIKNAKTKAIISSGKYANVTNFRDLPSYKKELVLEYGNN